MGKIIVTEFITVDGVIESPGPEPGAFDRAGWAFNFEQGDDGMQFKLDETLGAEALLLGRVTYQGFAAAWPAMSDPAGFADKMNGMPKYVVSATLDKADWNNSTIISRDIATEVAALKQRLSGDILVAGSAQLVQSLTDHGLVDEFRLMVFPIVLGSGKRLFGDTSNSMSLRLVESRPVGPDGIVLTTYRPASGDKPA